MDCISAVLATKAVLDDNGYELNWGRSIVYGHSHGAYLAHLSNLFAPGLFNLLIDNSAWLFPAYLNSKRPVSYGAGDKYVHLQFDYLAKNMGVADENLYHLPYLYDVLDTKCTLLIYQGTQDSLVDHREKEKFAEGIQTSHFHLFTEDDVDGEIFRSAAHGLDSDHIKLFALAYDANPLGFRESADVDLNEVRFNTDKAAYSIQYDMGVPLFKRS